MKKATYILIVMLLLFVLTNCNSNQDVDSLDSKISNQLFIGLPTGYAYVVNSADNGKYSWTDNMIKFWEYKPNRYTSFPRFEELLAYNFFPIIGYFNDFGEIQKDQKSIQELESMKFISYDSLDQYLSIIVDTIESSIEVRDRSFENTLRFKKHYIMIKNDSKDKFILRDRFHQLKLVLQAKNGQNEWKELHDIRKVGCGLENNLSQQSEIDVLPPNSYIKSCFFFEHGDFETECRVKYMFYNQIDSFYHRTGEDTGYFYKTFKIDKMKKPIYSPVFKQKIAKSRLRDGKNIF